MQVCFFSWYYQEKTSDWTEVAISNNFICSVLFLHAGVYTNWEHTDFIV